MRKSQSSRVVAVALASTALLGLSLGVPADQAGCGRAPSDEIDVGHTSEALTAQNGLTTNGLRAGIILNGIRTIILNGLRPIILNGLRPIILNGIELVSQAEIDEVVANLTSTEQATLMDGTPATYPDGSPMTKGSAARKLLQYIYECALPPTSTMTLTLNGVTYPEPYQGQLALAPEWETGACDTSCQRWISACVLARTNALGVRVPLSIRGDHPSLKGVSEEEMQAYPIREGAFWGNLFVDETIPYRNTIDHDCHFETKRVMNTCSSGAFLGTLTQRFCTGGACGIFDVGNCDAPPSNLHDYTQCEPINADGATGSCTKYCYVDGASAMPDASAPYAEVLTTYLRDPFPACGNQICDAGETHATCPTDCYDGAAIRLGGTAQDSAGTVRVAPDGSLILWSVSGSANVVTKLLPGGTQAWSLPQPTNVGSLSVDGRGNTLIQLYASAATPTAVTLVSPAGATLWTKSMPADVALLDSAGNAFVTGVNKIVTTTVTKTGTTTSTTYQRVVTKLSPQGATLWTVNLPGGSSAAAMAVDPAGNTTLGVFAGNLTHLSPTGTQLWSSTVSCGGYGYGVSADSNGNVFVVKPYSYGITKYSPTGVVQWTKSLGTSVAAMPDDAGGLFFASSFTASIDLGGGTLYDRAATGDIFLGRLASDGSLVWSTRFGGASREATPQLARGLSGSLIVHGVFEGTTNLNVGGTLTSAGGTDRFLLTILSSTFDSCTGPMTQTCASIGGNGLLINTCGGITVCGTGGSPTCVPRTCGTNCGMVPDGCNGVLDCGRCGGT